MIVKLRGLRMTAAEIAVPEVLPDGHRLEMVKDRSLGNVVYARRTAGSSEISAISIEAL